MIHIVLLLLHARRARFMSVRPALPRAVRRRTVRPLQKKTAGHAVRRRSFVGPMSEILQLAVAVQPGQEHVDAEERERRHQQARER
ncbi:hypothetical protein, partial [Burkholderia diffusa]|uniref:hypothetical protein n=1 Tax=Burkholderia diffusa TaxID=488732 RepID=UPI001E3A8CBA